MSASLVGSEMCIRDSWRATGTGLLMPTISTASATVRTPHLAIKASHVSVCLLYTSDAADDM
eukprot:9969307-Alexandrium_andersonii.AAC.1